MDRAEEMIWRILEHLDWSHSSKISHILALCARRRPHLFQTFSTWIIESMKMQFPYTLWVKDCESGCVIIQLPLICNLCRCIHLYIISMSTSLEYFKADGLSSVQLMLQRTGLSVLCGVRSPLCPTVTTSYLLNAYLTGSLIAIFYYYCYCCIDHSLFGQIMKTAALDSEEESTWSDPQRSNEVLHDESSSGWNASALLGNVYQQDKLACKELPHCLSFPFLPVHTSFSS